MTHALTLQQGGGVPYFQYKQGSVGGGCTSTNQLWLLLVSGTTQEQQVWWLTRPAEAVAEQIPHVAPDTTPGVQIFGPMYTKGVAAGGGAVPGVLGVWGLR